MREGGAGVHQAIQIRSFDIRMLQCADSLKTLVVRKKEQNIRLLGRLGAQRQRRNQGDHQQSHAGRRNSGMKGHA